MHRINPHEQRCAVPRIRGLGRRRTKKRSPLSSSALCIPMRCHPENPRAWGPMGAAADMGKWGEGSASRAPSICAKSPQIDGAPCLALGTWETVSFEAISKPARTVVSDSSLTSQQPESNRDTKPEPCPGFSANPRASQVPSSPSDLARPVPYSTSSTRHFKYSVSGKFSTTG
jgi:hypothetical protein